MRLLFPHSRFFLGSRLLPGAVSLGICRLFVQLTGHSHSGSLLSQTGFHEQLAIHRGSELSEVFYHTFVTCLDIQGSFQN